MPRFRTAALLLLAGWSVLLSLESWFRPPGPANPYRFPAELSVGGVGFLRVQTRPDHAALPAGVTVREGADYHSSTGQHFYLRWITLASSGTGVALPLEPFSEAVLGPGASGVCRLTPEPGRPPIVVRSASDFQQGLAGRLPSGVERLRWLAGLRPLIPHGCLWMGRLGPPAEPFSAEPPLLQLRP